MNIYINKFLNPVLKIKNIILIINFIVLFNKNVKYNTMYYCLVSKKASNAEGLFVPSVL